MGDMEPLSGEDANPSKGRIRTVHWNYILAACQAQGVLTTMLDARNLDDLRCAGLGEASRLYDCPGGNSKYSTTVTALVEPTHSPTPSLFPPSAGARTN